MLRRKRWPTEFTVELPGKGAEIATCKIEQNLRRPCVQPFMFAP